MSTTRPEPKNTDIMHWPLIGTKQTPDPPGEARRGPGQAQERPRRGQERPKREAHEDIKGNRFCEDAPRENHNNKRAQIGRSSFRVGHLLILSKSVQTA